MVISFVYTVIGVVVYFFIITRVEVGYTKSLIQLYKKWGKFSVDVAYFVIVTTLWLPLLILNQMQK